MQVIVAISLQQWVHVLVLVAEYQVHGTCTVVHSPATAAMSWAESIAAPEQRQEVMVEVARSWRRKGGQGLTEWLSGSGLSADVQESIMSSRDRRRR